MISSFERSRSFLPKLFKCVLKPTEKNFCSFQNASCGESIMQAVRVLSCAPLSCRPDLIAADAIFFFGV